MNYSDYLLNTYKRENISFVKGKNAILIDSKGKKYIDFLSGLGVNNLGHGNVQIIKAIKKYATFPLHVTNLFDIPSQTELAKAIQQKTFKGRSFFCNSGTEANELAYKFLLKYGASQSSEKRVILTATDSFHGRTLAGLNLSGQKAIKDGYKPFLNNIKHFKFNDIDSFNSKIGDEVAGVLIELVQGEAGINLSRKSFLSKMIKKCYQHNALVIIDEVQSGCMRTGEMFSFLKYGIKIDGFTAAKALANGLPIGMFQIKEKYKNILKPGDHGSTFGGNPFVTSVALSAFKEYSSTRLKSQVKKNTSLFSELLLSLKKEMNNIVEIRQSGLMIAIDFKKGTLDTNEIRLAALKKGLIVNSIKDHIIRLLPPLTIEKEIIVKGMDILKKTLFETAHAR